jgi:iron(III) transport system permease protein
VQRTDQAIGVGTRVLVGVVVLFIAFLVLYPLAWLFYGSFRSGTPFESRTFTLNNYRRAYEDRLILDTGLTTLLFAGGQTVLSVSLGTALGWILTRTNTPGRRVFEFLILVLYLVPSILQVVAWTLLLSPTRGLLNHLLIAVFGLSQSPFNIFGLGGMIFVQGVLLTPLVFLIVAPVFLASDAALEESARMSGAGPFRTLFRVTLPMARPAILSASALTFIVGLESFEVPQLLGASKGIYTYTSLIFFQILVRYPPDYGSGTALATTLLGVSTLCVWYYRHLTRQGSQYETVRGKGYRVAILDIGRWRWLTCSIAGGFFLVTVGLPIAVLFVGSLLQFYGRFDLTIFDRMSWANYPKLLEHPALGRALTNSLLLGIVGGLGCTLLSAVVAYISVRTQLRWRGGLETIAMLPVALPATVLAVGLLWAYIAFPLPVYGTIFILAIAYVTRYIPVGVRTLSGGMFQIGSELEEASRMAGASLLTRYRRIVLPLLRPSLFAAWMLLFMIFFREFSMSLLLAGPANPVTSVVLYDYYESSATGPLSALALVLVALVIGVVFLAQRVMRISFTNLRVSY